MDCNLLGSLPAIIFLHSVRSEAQLVSVLNPVLQT